MVSLKKIIWIDYIKAFACFLVVLGHLLQSLTKAGIDPIINITSYINYSIYLFHMPLFMCISGFLYNHFKKELTIEEYKSFELKKIINLLVPYITFYVIYMLLNTIFSASVNSPKGLTEWVGILNNPISPYWYLYALLSIFIITPILEIIFVNKKFVLVFFAIIKFISIFYHCKLYFVSSIMGWGIYFYFGCFIDKKVTKKKNWIFYMLLCLYFILSLILFNNVSNINTLLIELLMFAMAIIGIVLFINIFKNIKKNKLLDTYKEYTFEIFLTHTIFAAFIRIILLKVGIENYIIHLILGLISSIYLPVLMSKISKKIGYTEFFFYPLKTIEKYKRSDL